MRDADLHGRFQSWTWKRIPSYFTGTWRYIVDMLAWLYYDRQLVLQVLKSELWLHRASGPTPIGLRVKRQPAISGVTVLLIVGQELGGHCLTWNVNEQTLQWDNQAPVAITVAGDYHLWDTPTTAEDWDATIESPIVAVNVNPGRLPSLNCSSSITVIQRMGFPFLDRLAGLRNRFRYPAETDAHLRLRMVRGVGRELSRQAIRRELNALLGYVPVIIERSEEWSGFAVPGLGFIGYAGRSNFPPIGSGILQERWAGLHAKSRSDKTWHCWLRVKDADVGNAYLPTAIRRTFAAQTQVTVVGGL